MTKLKTLEMLFCWKILQNSKNWIVQDYFYLDHFSWTENPITAILMSLQLLEDKRVGSLNGEQEQLSKNIKATIARSPYFDITGEVIEHDAGGSR